MVRVSGRPASARHGLARASRRTPRGITQKHKVIMESITQEKKKLRSVISFETEAPPGYTFIPAGNPRLTAACKEACRKGGLGVFAVTTTPHLRIHNLSQHVHRIGYHFPSAIVANACMDLGLYLTATGKAMPFYNVGNSEGSLLVNSEASQITINTEARDVLRDLFPNIPDTDLNQIIKTAFQKGQKKVGTALELPLARRAQLAVVAHIRHVYTNYDRLLKTTSFHEARSQIEEPTLAKVVEWRGDDENGKTVLEDVFREVIVISDDEETDPEADRSPSTDSTRSVEIISSDTVREELQAQPANYADLSVRESLRDLSDDEAPPGLRIVPHVPKRDKIDRRGFSRYQAWDRAINRYRKNTNEIDRRLHHGPTDHQKPSLAWGQPLHENLKKKTESFPVTTPYVSASFTCPNENNVGSSRLNDNVIARSVIERRVSIEGKPIITPDYRCSQPQIHERNNLILTFNEPYELYRPAEPRHQGSQFVSHLPEFPLPRAPTVRHESQLFRQDDAADPPVFVSSLSKNATWNEGRLNSQSLAHVSSHTRERLSPQDRVLPSIEGPQNQLLENRRHNNDQVKHLPELVSDGVSLRSVTPCRLPCEDISYQGDGNNSTLPTPKRRRVAHYEPIRDDSRIVGHYEPVNPIRLGAPKDAFVGDSFVPPGYILTRQRPVQDNMHTRRNYAVSVGPPYLARRHWDDHTNALSYSTHLNPEFGLSPGWRSTDHRYTHLSHNHGVRLNTQRRDSPQCHKLPSTNYAIPVDYPFSRASPMHSSDLGTSLMRPKKRELSADGLGATGVTESVAPSVHDMTNDRVLANNDVPRRRELYAEDFVRPVGLFGSDTLDPTPYRNLRINRATEASGSSLKVHDPTRNELHGNNPLMMRRSRSPFHFQAAHPARDNSSVNYHQDTTSRRGRMLHSSTATGKFERHYQSPARNTHERAPWSVDQYHLGHEGTVTQAPTHCSIPSNRPVIILD